MMKKTIFKKLMVLCTSASLAFGTVPAGAADVVPQAVTVETVSAQAAKPGKNLKDKDLAKSLDKVIKALLSCDRYTGLLYREFDPPGQG